MSNITIRDVAAHAGVSISTVSRVINNPKSVRQELVNKVEAAVEELKFIPNDAAKRIRSKKTDTLGIILPSVHTMMLANVLEGTLAAAQKYNYKMFIYSSEGSIQKESNCLMLALGSNLDGLLYCPISDVCSSQFEEFLGRDIPVVLVSRRNIKDGLTYVYSDNEQGSYMATKYLIQQGHRNIAFFAGFWENTFGNKEKMKKLIDTMPSGIYSGFDRFHGYRRALQEYNLEVNWDLVIITEFSYKSGYYSTKRFLACLHEFDAIMCANDYVAGGVIRALQEQNISVPDDVSVIGYDDDIIAQMCHPPLTTVRQPSYDMGYMAVETVIAKINGEMAESKLVEQQLIIRNSSAAKKYSNP